MGAGDCEHGYDDKRLQSRDQRTLYSGFAFLLWVCVGGKEVMRFLTWIGCMR